MNKIFNTGLLIYLIISLTTLRFVEAAASETKKPCDDFYEYACNSHIQTNKEISQDLESELHKKLLSFLNSVIVKRRISNINPTKFETYFDKIITYFEACINQRYNFLVYLQPLNDLMNTNPDIWSVLGKTQSYGLNNVIINYNIKRNINNKLDITLAPVDLTNDEPLCRNNAKIIAILELLGYKDEEAKLQWLNTCLKWQDDVNKYNNSNNLTWQVTSLINCKYRKLQRYLKNLLEADFDNIAVINIQNLDYFKFLVENDWDTEATLKYLIIKYLYYLHEDGTKNFEPTYCVQDLRNKFDLGLNYIYYHSIFKRNDRNALLNTLSLFNMLHNIKGVMSKQFQYNNLQLSGKQIKYLQTKLAAVKINIGNLPHNFNYNQINSYYQDIPRLDSSNYFTNHLLLLKHRFRKSISYMENATYSPGFDSNTATTPCLPFYEPAKNMIVIPTASLELPLFSHQQTPLQQLSVFGFIMAHELTHAIDNWGLLYDHQGVQLFNPPDILQHANFKASLNCMQQQEYTKYVHERIADLFAIRVVYHTYLEYYAKKEDHTWSKEFFENFALFFCGDNNLQYVYHDSDAVRLQQVVKNFSPFSWTYKCPEDSAMNLKQKCRLY